MATLHVENDGQLIVATNYWRSDLARLGACYLSLNAGAFRLLLPDEEQHILAEVESAYEVVVSRGPWPEGGKADALELLFEEGSSHPFAIHMGVEQVDRMPLDSDADQQWIFTVWIDSEGEPLMALSLPCWYRRVQRLPCLESRDFGY